MPSDRYQITLDVKGQDNTGQSLTTVNSKLANLNKTSTSTSNKVGAVGTAFGQLKSELTGVVAGFGLLKLGSTVAELRDMGQQANNVDAVFESLTGGADAAKTTLADLRSATGGIVDDMALMQNANQLLITGLAATNDKAVELTQLGVRLGAALGQDPVAAIENLNAALLNNSFPRLDTLGISAARVRERVKELKEEGLDMSEAFAQAVLEQGQAALTRLGDAATVAETSFGRVQASIENARQNLGQLLADAGETAAQLIILGDIALGGDGFGAVDKTLVEADPRKVILNRATELQGDEDRLLSEFRIDPVAQIAVENRDLFDRLRAGSLEGAISGGGGGGISEQDIADLESVLGVDFDGFLVDTERVALETVTAIEAIGQAVDEIDAEVAAEKAEAAFNRWSGVIDTTQSKIISLGSNIKNELIDQFQETQQLELFDDINAGFNQLEAFNNANTFGIGGNTFFDPEALDAVQQRAELLQEQADSLREQAESNEFRFISEDDVANAESIAKEASEIAKEAERGAEAFAGLSLSGLLGEDSGGRLGELLDLVTEDLAASIGTDDETGQARLEDLQSGFNLETGRETDLSQFVDDVLSDQIAAIAQQFGPEIAAQAAQAALGVIEQGQIAGLSDEDIQKQASFQVLQAGAGAQFQNVQDSQVGQFAQNLFGAVAPNLLQAPSTVATPQLPSQSTAALTGLIPSGQTITDETVSDSEDEAIISDTDLEKFGIIEEGLQSISKLDFSPILDPFVDDLDLAFIGAEGLFAALSDISSGVWGAKIPLEIFVEDNTGFSLGSNPTFWQAVSFSFTSRGYDINKLK